LDSEELLVRHQGRRAIVDTNLLLLYLVGSFRRDQITRLCTTRAYTENDFDILQRVVDFLGGIVTTGHILAEVNALTSNMKQQQQQNKKGIDSLRQQFLSRFAQEIPVLNEKLFECSGFSTDSLFAKLGLTDTGIAHIASLHQFLVLTDDFGLYGALISRGIPALNFTHLRSFDI
jgi:rRNA-processing protein FCF1